ncbi:hypothetical protein Lal_00001737 [Lupinus albus]|nr:hypothetical protein Lal_00001737 [Lupinus albus]
MRAKLRTCMLGWRFSLSESQASHRNLVPVEEKLLLVRVGSYPSIVMAVQSRLSSIFNWGYQRFPYLLKFYKV